jgi:universal stress protein A
MELFTSELTLNKDFFMPTYKHILLATDLSKGAGAITEKAVNLAKKSNAKISIVHVIEHSPIVYGGGEFSIPIGMHLEEQLACYAKKAMKMLSQQFNIKSEDQYIMHGSIKREIIEIALQLNADLIVLGSHGHSGVEHLLGATANAILHAAKCDVLAVRIRNALETAESQSNSR